MILYQTSNHPPPPPQRGPDKWTPACDSPNPPPWCENLIPSVPIDGFVFQIGVVILIVVFLIVLKNRNKLKLWE